MLSTSYKKAAELAKKSSKVAMSLIILITAVLGFNSLTGTETINNVISKSAPKSGSDSESIPSASVNTTGDTKEIKQVVKSVSNNLSTQEIVNELDFANAQLESAAVMLQTMQLVESAQEGNN